MTIEELRLTIQTASWFSRLGEPDYEGQSEYVFLPNMDEWQNLTGILANERVPRIIADGMEWLPTSNEQDDPIHGSSLARISHHF